MTAIAALRPAIALLAYGFRPFFLLAGLYATLGVAVWAAAFAADFSLPTSIPPGIWHGHEMLYGFAAAAAAGFLLTAVPSWAQTKARSGFPLAVAVDVWLAGRIVFWAGDAVNPAFTAVIDLAFLPVLAGLVVGPVIRARQVRNVVFLLLLGILFTGNLLVHLELVGLTADTAESGLRLGAYGFALMIVVIGGRIAPRFTANALISRRAEVEVRSVPVADGIGIAGTVAAAAADLANAPALLIGTLALIAAAGLFWRMAHWQTVRILDQPILWILHLAYAWVPVAFACKAVAALTGTLPDDSALHALTTGAIGTAILAVMTRAGLGHTGRALIAPPAIVAAYALILAAGVVRVFGPLAGAFYLDTIVVSATLWVVAFGLFSVFFAPILIRSRPDGKPG